MKTQNEHGLTPNQEKFKQAYYRHLARLANEGVYRWPASEAEHVGQRILVAIENGSYNKDGPAFVATCKELGIKHTYKAINEYWAS